MLSISTSPDLRTRGVRVDEITQGHCHSWPWIYCQKRVRVGRTLIATDTRPSHSHGPLSAFTPPLWRTRKSKTVMRIHIPWTSDLGIGGSPVMLNSNNPTPMMVRGRIRIPPGLPEDERFCLPSPWIEAGGPSAIAC